MGMIGNSLVRSALRMGPVGLNKKSLVKSWVLGSGSTYNIGLKPVSFQITCFPLDFILAMNITSP